MSWWLIFLGLLRSLIPIKSIKDFIQQVFPKLQDRDIDFFILILTLAIAACGTFGLVDRYLNEKKMQTQINDLKKNEEERKWERASRFSYICNSNQGGTIIDGEQIGTLMKSSYKFLDNGRHDRQCSETIIANLIKVTNLEPTCPYPFYNLAYCGQFANMSEKEIFDNLQEAKKILDKTTKLEGRNRGHDSLLVDVNASLKTFEK